MTEQQQAQQHRVEPRVDFDPAKLAAYRVNVAMLTREELAGRVGTGVSVSLVYAWEAGRRRPTIVMFRDLCAALGVDPAQLRPDPPPAVRPRGRK